MVKVRRLDYVDVCKWLGISLVIFGHMKMPNEVLQWIYAFHMPLFFVLSGYTYRVQTFSKEYLVKKIKTIYMPFLLFAMIFSEGDLSSWAYIAYGSRNALEMAGTYTVLWFLPCFLVSVLVFSLLMNVSAKSRHSKLVVVLGVILMLVMAKICEYLKLSYPILSKYGYPMNFDMSLVGSIFMVAGLYFKRVIEWFNTQMQWRLILTVFVLLLLTLFSVFVNLPQSLNPLCDHVEMSVGSLGNWWLFFINALLLSFALIGLSVLIDKWLSNKKMLLFIGKNSLTILCVHGVMLLIASKILTKIGLTGECDVELLLRGAISYVIVIVVSIPVIKLIKRFAPNLVGK